jgi:hypothetical protein
MKIPKQELHKIITEELSNVLHVLRENVDPQKINWDKIAAKYQAILIHKGEESPESAKRSAQEAVDVAKSKPNGLEALRGEVLQVYQLDITKD